MPYRWDREQRIWIDPETGQSNNIRAVLELAESAIRFAIAAMDAPHTFDDPIRRLTEAADYLDEFIDALRPPWEQKGKRG